MTTFGSRDRSGCSPVSPVRARQEIGATAYKRLRKLQQWLYGNDGDLEFRYAPSLIARSEAELFGISSPRFAMRTEFRQPSIVNVRRLPRFVENVAAVNKRLVEPDDAHLVRPSRRLLKKELLGSGQCIADSLFSLPSRLDDYRTLKCEFGTVYGEGREITGTPFLQHIPVGGGLCAQAACFMVLAIQQQVVTSIFGIAEITALAAGGNDAQIALTGMTRSKITRFLNDARVGLCAYELTGNCSQEIWAIAIRSYLRSGVPLLLPTDLGRMWGDLPDCENEPHLSVMHKNNLRRHRSRRKRGLQGKYEVQDHAVVLVGYSGESNRDSFLINDPGSYPFLKVDMEDIFRVRPYERQPGGRKYVTASSKQRPLLVISATHDAVKLPLLRIARGNELSSFGLLDMAVDLLNTEGHLVGAESADLRSELGTFTLVDLQKRADVYQLRGHESICDIFSKTVQEGFLNELGKKPVRSGWYWLQYVRPSVANAGKGRIRLWNAEKSEPETLEDYPEYLVASFTVSGSGAISRDGLDGHQTGESFLASGTFVGNDSNRASLDDGKERNEPTENKGAERSLRVSLLSLFCARGVAGPQSGDVLVDLRANGRSPADDDIVPIELYVFMEEEMRRWVDVFARTWSFRGLSWRLYRPLNAAEFLARLIDQEADRILERVKSRFPAARWPIIGLASFLPEITRAADAEGRHNMVIPAIRRLLYMADSLRRDGHPARFVEMVTGSAMQGVWLDRQSEKTRHFHATRVSRSEAVRRLLANIERVLDEPRAGSSDVSLALELEPGPCFVLKDWETLKELCSHLDRNKKLSHRVGYNLDIGHWRIAKIASLDVGSNRDDAKAIRRRIVHAHVSAHHRCAHFADAPLVDDIGKTLAHNGDGELLPWLHLLRMLPEVPASDAGQSPRCPPFSGYVSLELEAAKNMELVIKSIEKLKELLSNV